ncbi:hypothetical protein K466DRAFT_195537 [Polyporus arcularius HHB13444]|uniref:Uncharacterized protein n=1 Tax=Polyporus arcularius HHB13444 TaxID=1314778 RepID=A0A5C3PSK9_9APHY|nr:hypothetical protein K466DRAFT_195537 [Polyporus arcularius HHB13444]
MLLLAALARKLQLSMAQNGATSTTAHPENGRSTMYMASEGICHRAYYTVTDIWQAGYGRSASKTLATIGEVQSIMRYKPYLACTSCPYKLREHWTRSDIHRDFFKSAAHSQIFSCPLSRRSLRAWSAAHPNPWGSLPNSRRPGSAMQML